MLPIAADADSVAFRSSVSRFSVGGDIPKLEATCCFSPLANLASASAKLGLAIH
jgi:hypothetical protein